MMGIPESQMQFVFDQTNIILGLGDPEYVAEGTNPLLAALTGSGKALAELMNELAAERRKSPTDDLTSQLLNAEIDGEASSPIRSWRPSSCCWWPRATRPRATPSATA